jgi:hypothetical protein
MEFWFKDSYNSNIYKYQLDSNTIYCKCSTRIMSFKAINLIAIASMIMIESESIVCTLTDL